MEVRKIIQILGKELCNGSSQGWIQLLYLISELIVQIPFVLSGEKCTLQDDTNCSLTSLISLWKAHTQLTHMEVFILRGDECYSYIAKDVFAR